MEIAIFAALGVGALALIAWNAARKKKEAARPAPPPSTQPLTPEQIAERQRLGEQWEDFKRDNNIKGP
jgi:hypothetical protein